MIAAGTAKKRAPIKEWGKLPWIAWSDDLDGFPPARWLAKHVPRTAIVLRTSHFSTHVSAVAAGVGAALLPPVFARLAAVAPVRHAAALAPSVSELTINETWLIGHRALRSVPRVAAVWAFLVEEFANFEPATARWSAGARP